MSKYYLITDQHFGVRNDSQIFVEYYNNFYSNVVIPFIHKFKIERVICLGDTFDKRKSVNFNSLEAAKNMWFDPLEKMGVSLTMLVGNHDIYYKNTLRINSPSLLLGEYGNISIMDNPGEFFLDSLPILGVPWICDENRSRVYELLEQSTAPICMGHFEFNGFEAHPGHVMDHGISTEPFQKFNKVISGHYHSKSNKGNVYYLGNPYELYWNDYKSKRGFHVLDTQTLELKFYRNPFTMFHKEYYNDDSVIEDYKQFSNKYVKIIVENKTDSTKFDKVIEEMYNAGVAELKIIEDLSTEYDLSDDLEVETEDTLSLLERCVDEIENCDKSSVKTVLKSLYKEAFEL